MKLGSFSKIFLSIVFVFCVITAFVPSDVLAEANSSTSGGWAQLLKLFGDIIGNVISPLVWVGSLIWLGIGQILLAMSGFFFDQAMVFTVSDVSGTYENVFSKSVTLLWKIFRDFGNLIIIFSMLYLAIKTILQGDGFADKKALTGILLAALLINFSLFFVKLVFDSSNIVSVSIYNSINASSEEGRGKSLSSRIAQELNIKSVYEESKSDQNNLDKQTTAVARTIFGFTYMFVIAMVFIMASLFLLVRLLIFILLMITAPIGLVGKLIPFLRKHTESWWEQLWKQAISLPVFMLMFYISFLFMQQQILAKNIQVPLSQLFTGDINSYTASTFQNLFIYIFMIVLLYITVYLPGRVGGIGSKIILSGTGKMVGAGSALLGRRTIGYASRKLAASKGLQEATKSKGFTGFMARRTIDAAKNIGEKRTFDFRNIKVGDKTVGEKYGLGKGVKSYNDIKEEKEKEVEKEKKEAINRYGLDKRTPEEKALAAIRESELEEEKKPIVESNKNRIRQYRKAVEAYGADSDEARTILRKYADNQERIDNIQKEIFQIKNPGDYSYERIANSSINRLMNILKLNFEKNEALSKMMEKQEKEWKKDKDKKLVEDLKKAMKDEKKDES